LSFLAEAVGAPALATDHDGDVYARSGERQAGFEVKPVGGALRGQRCGKGGTLLGGEAVGQVVWQTVEEAAEFGRWCRGLVRLGRKWQGQLEHDDF
jgi:hypothetical protein